MSYYYRAGVYSSTADKATRKALQKLETVALTAAAKGDAKTAQVSFITAVTATLLAGNTWRTLTLYPGFQVAIKEFVTLGQITEMDMVKGTTFNPKTACDRPGLQCGKGYEGYVGSRSLD